jgi:vacuolar-type H+-ATPase subunit E/Vma4
VILSESHVLEALARVVVEDAEAACRREEDRALNEARRLRLEAEDHVARLSAAARELGRTRGRAAEAAETEAGAAEIAAVEAGAFDALFERFLRHVRLRLRALPGEPGYPGALAAWAAHAARAADGPLEVFSSKRDRPAVYEALRAAGLEDFRVRVDHAVHVGFVARALDGRTRADCRPDALLEAHRAALRALLRSRVPTPPRGLAPADVS